MTELIATAIITTSSGLLFAYWFRYTCLLILSAKTTRDYAAQVALANQLSFPQIQSVLRHREGADLDRLKDSLDRDYKVLTYLLEHSANAVAGEAGVEKRMLQVNYRMMGVWYSVSNRFSSSAARRALDEMAAVVAHFANAMGERTLAGAAA